MLRLCRPGWLEKQRLSWELSARGRPYKASLQYHAAMPIRRRWRFAAELSAWSARGPVELGRGQVGLRAGPAPFVSPADIGRRMAESLEPDREYPSLSLQKRLAGDLLPGDRNGRTDF